jgi:hypothetical protein
MVSNARLRQLDVEEAAGLASRSTRVAREHRSGRSERPAWARPWLWCLDERRKQGKRVVGCLDLSPLRRLSSTQKQVVKETEYHDVRAQLNKIKFTTILIFIPSKRYLPSLNKFGEKYLVIDCESRNKFGYWNFFQNSMDFELFTRFRVKAGLTEICSNKLVATTIANLSKLKVGQRVLHDDP